MFTVAVFVDSTLCSIHSPELHLKEYHAIHMGVLNYHCSFAPY